MAIANLNPFNQFPYPNTPEGEDHIRKYACRYQFKINPNHRNSHIKYLTNPRPEYDKPTIATDKQDMYSKLEDAVVRASGSCNFVLGMNNEDVYEVWPRYNQPCQGGEMRKYGITHDDCTRPKDPRPGDLYTPFPDGTPLAVGSRLNHITEQWLNLLVNPNSVYRRAYATEENVERVYDNGELVGIIIKDVSVAEPTMIVTLFKDLKAGERYPLIMKAIEAGYTLPEAFLLFKMGVLTGSRSWGFSGAPDREGSLEWVNKSFIRGGIEASTDLTGGTLGQRFDYHRPNLMNVFRGPVGTNISMSHIKNTVFKGDTTLKDSLTSFRDVVKEHVEKAA